MVTVAFSHHTKHTTVHAGPVALLVSPQLLELAQRCVTVATGVLPPMAPSAITDASPACTLLAAADGAAQWPQGPTATVRIQGASVAVRLPVGGVSEDWGRGLESQVCSQAAFAQCELRVGTVAPPACIARLVDDVRVMQDRMPQLHTSGMHARGMHGASAHTPKAPPFAQPPAASWLQCAHACSSGRAARGPIESLSMALTIPLHVSIPDSSVSLMLSQHAESSESHMHVDSPTSPHQAFYAAERELFPAGCASPVATLGTARASMRLPVAQFAPVAANLALHDLVAQVEQAHIDSAQCLMRAAQQLSRITDALMHASAGERTARSTHDAAAANIPPVELKAEVNSAKVTVSRGGDYHNDACAQVSWSQLHASFCSDASRTVLQSMPIRCAAFPAVACHTCMFGELAPNAPEVAVELAEFEVICLNGCIGDVMHEVHAYIPSRTVRAAFSHMAAKVQLQAPFHALQSIKADIYNLRADATGASGDSYSSPMHASYLHRMHAWEAPPQPLRVIDTASTAQDEAQASFSLGEGHKGSEAVAEAASSRLRIQFSNIGRDDVSKVLEADTRGIPIMPDMHTQQLGTGNSPPEVPETPFGSAVSILILRSRVCAQYLTEILSGWPKGRPGSHKESGAGASTSTGRGTTEEPGLQGGSNSHSKRSSSTAHAFHPATSQPHMHGSSSASLHTSPHKTSKAGSGGKASAVEASASDNIPAGENVPAAPNVAFSLDIVDSELFVSLPGKLGPSPEELATGDTTPPPPVPGRRRSDTARASPVPVPPPLATGPATRQGQGGVCATVAAKRWHMLLHPELAAVSHGLSMAAVVAMRVTEQRAEELRVEAGCVHERAAAAGAPSHGAESEVPPMTPMTGLSFTGGPLGTCPTLCFVVPHIPELPFQFYDEKVLHVFERQFCWDWNS